MEQSNDITKHAGLVLGYLCDKAVLHFTPEDTIEKAFDGIIHYFHVRQALNLLISEGYVVYARVGGAYAITGRGRKFHREGGYKASEEGYLPSSTDKI